jgi:hypothetical protein
MFIPELAPKAVALLTAFLLGSGALAGCTQPGEATPLPSAIAPVPGSESTPTVSPTPSPAYEPLDLEDCYPRPVAEPKRPTGLQSGKQISLTQNSHDLLVSGNPGQPKDEVLQHVIGALVAIGKPNNDGKYATGFLVKPNVVVTAAHVSGGMVVDSTGQKAEIVDGCKIHQLQGKPTPPDEGKVGTVDVKILTLSRNLGSAVLEIGPTPARGQWGTAVDYHRIQRLRGDSPPIGQPNVYDLLFVSTDHTSPKGTTVLSGIDSDIYKPLPADEYTIGGGASGGPIVDAQGRVIALTYASRNSPYETRAEVISQCGVDIGPAPGDDFWPTDGRFPAGLTPELGYVVPPHYINLALASGRY